MSWWSRETQPGRRERIRDGFECDYRKSIGLAQKAAHRTTQRMARQPNVGSRIELGDIVIKVLSGGVVASLVSHGGDQTSRVAGVGTGLTVTDLAPQILPALAAAATEVQIVVDLVISGRARAVEDGR